MWIAMMLKIFSDCCIYFAILGIGPVSFQIPLLLPALLCGISAGIATCFHERNWMTARRLSAVLPLLSILLAETGQQMLILSIPAVYTALVIFRGKLELEYYSYRRSFIRSLALVGASYVVVNVWVFLAMATGDPAPELYGSVILRYGLVHLLCGVMLQRQLRLGTGQRSEGGRRQVAMLLATVGCVILAFVAAEPMLRQHAATVMKYVVTAMMTPVMLLVELLSWIISLFERKQPEHQKTDATVDFSGEGAVSIGKDSVGQVTEQLQEKTLNPNMIWIVVSVIFLVAAGVILFRSFQKGRFSELTAEIEGLIAAPAGKKKPSALSNRARVRQLYREFLKVEQGWGLKLKSCDTSADVLQRIHPETDRQSAWDLRQVYLAARYDDRTHVTKSQISAAKQALKGTRKTKR